jgi:hypothetical protein
MAKKPGTAMCAFAGCNETSTPDERNHNMKCKLFSAALAASLLFSHAAFAESPALSTEEQAQGWKLLFNGKNLDGWRSFKKKEAPRQGWVVEDGLLTHKAKAGGGDIITEATFNDFDLTWEWKLAPGANSGLKYFITEERTSAIGHEYQLIDDAGHKDALLAEGKRVTASFYDVFPPKGAKPQKAGEWNASRVLVQGNHVTHWLNGTKVLEYELGSPAVLEAVTHSKFKPVKDFGTKIKGHILLQDHGDEITFRNLKIRELKSATP